jgi:hypothetical protein
MNKQTLDTLQQVNKLRAAHFDGAPTDFLTATFAETERLFAGHYPGYQRSDTAYHDLNHTCCATLVTAQILNGHLLSEQPPALTARDFDLAIAAALLHDTGYIKQVGDTSGTGAKYTLTHVERSAQLAAKFLMPLGVLPAEIRTVQQAIRCTAVTADPHQAQFQTDVDRFLACALGTGDILGQMAAPDYPERLQDLYSEFVEAAACEKLEGFGIGSYRSAKELLSQTRSFYNNFVQKMLEVQWGGVHRALQHHFGSGRNAYLEAIERNLDRIDQLLSQPAVPTAKR